MSLNFTEELFVMTMRMIKKLNRNWLIGFELTRGAFDPSTRKNLPFNWLLVTKVYNVWATKVRRSYLSSKTNLWCEKWREKFGKFSPEHLKMSKLMGSFCPKYKRYDLKIYRGGMEMKNNAKFKEELTCHFKTDMRNLPNFDSSTRKTKSCSLIGSLI